MKQVPSAHDVVRMKAQTTPHNNVTLLHKQALNWTPTSSCLWQAQVCLNMLQLAHYDRMDNSLSSGIHVILTHCNLNFDFWPDFDAFWLTVHSSPLSAGVRIDGTIPPLLNKPLWHVQGKGYIHLTDFSFLLSTTSKRSYNFEVFQTFNSPLVLVSATLSATFNLPPVVTWPLKPPLFLKVHHLWLITIKPIWPPTLHSSADKFFSIAPTNI